jgi:hypothetical protein
MKEMGKAIWESRVKVSDDMVYDGIVARGRGIVQVSETLSTSMRVSALYAVWRLVCCLMKAGGSSVW